MTLSFRHAGLFTLLLASAARATDRIVEEFGVAPTYPNITAAVAAAVDGDRIVVKNRAGNIPWIENIAITKSLQFLSFANDDFFYVQGDYTITAAPGRAVTIIGMRNTAGNILGTGSGGDRDTKVRVMDSYFVNGSVTMNLDFFDVDLVSSKLVNGAVSICYGNVVGNDIDASQLAGGIKVQPSTAAGPLDTCAIIGNKVKSAAGADGIFVNTTAQVVHIRNNYVQHGYMGLRIYAGNTSGVQNLVWNNTITAWTGNFTTYAIDFANTNAGSIWEVMNNAVTATWSGGQNRGINKDSNNFGQINVYFNHVHNALFTPISADFTFVGNNTTDQQLLLNADGTFATAPAAIDGGNPSPVFSDLDLSPGDAGAYGGSYTLNNFFPLHTGAARVYMTGHAFNVRTGSTLRVKATAFDR